MNILEIYVKELLTELRDFPFTKIPDAPDYIARLYHNGNVGYFEKGKSFYAKDPANPLTYVQAITGKPTELIDHDPQLKKIAGLLHTAGLLSIKASSTKHREDRLVKSMPWKFKSEKDVPPEIEGYSQGFAGYDRSQNSVTVNTSNKSIDLSVEHLGYNTRRPGKNRDGKSYVIPSGDVAFEGRQRDLQKLLKHILLKDPRVTEDFKIVGAEQYRKMTLGDVIATPRQVDQALTGQQGSIVMYHGTSSKRWKTIQKKGLIPGRGNEVYVDLVPGWSEHNVYLTFDPNIAENYATRAAIKDGGKAMVLKVEVPDYTRLRPDEDAMGYLELSRPYDLELTPNPSTGKARGFTYNDYEGDHTQQVQNVYPRNTLENIHNKAYKMTDEFFAFEKELLQKLSTEITKKGLNKGIVAYNGPIFPKFIKPFMEYKKQSFKTPERKGGPSDREYGETRKGVQDTATRFDEVRLRKEIRKMLRAASR